MILLLDQQESLVGLYEFFSVRRLLQMTVSYHFDNPRHFPEVLLDNPRISRMDQAGLGTNI